MKPIVRSILTAAVIALAIQSFSVWILSTSLPSAVGRADVYDVRTLSLPAARHLSLSNEDGSVQVRAVPVAEISIEAAISGYKRGDATEEDVRSYIATLISVRASADGISVTTEPAERPDRVALSVEYTILVPEGTDLEIRASNGNVWVSKGCGQVRVQGRNSDIEILEPRGPVNASSTNGRIRVMDAPEGASLHTDNGNITAYVLGGALEAITTNGAITARMLDADVTRCKLSSQNGGVTFIMSDGCSATIDAVTERGNVRSDIAEETSNGGGHRRRLHGTVGSGHTKVEIDTLNGNIWVARSEL